MDCDTGRFSPRLSDWQTTKANRLSLDDLFIAHLTPHESTHVLPHTVLESNSLGVFRGATFSGVQVDGGSTGAGLNSELAPLRADTHADLYAGNEAIPVSGGHV
jgi:hypothetical protein